MTQCFRCKKNYPLTELKRYSSGKSYCLANCALKSFYKCEQCGVKFFLGDYSPNYDEAKKTAWKVKSEHASYAHV